MECTITDSWIGYDFVITKINPGYISVGFSDDTDMYRIHGEHYEEAAMAILKEMLNLLQAIGKREVYYKSERRRAYIATKNLDLKTT